MSERKFLDDKGLVYFSEKIKKYIGTNGQKDWTENDSTSSAYIQNRTHYEEDAIKATATVYSFRKGTSSDITTFGGDGFFELVPEKTYTLEYNGQTYENLVYKSYSGRYSRLILGNPYDVLTREFVDTNLDLNEVPVDNNVPFTFGIEYGVDAQWYFIFSRGLECHNATITDPETRESFTLTFTEETAPVMEDNRSIVVNAIQAPQAGDFEVLTLNGQRFTGTWETDTDGLTLQTDMLHIVYGTDPNRFEIQINPESYQDDLSVPSQVQIGQIKVHQIDRKYIPDPTFENLGAILTSSKGGSSAEDWLSFPVTLTKDGIDTDTVVTDSQGLINFAEPNYDETSCLADIYLEAGDEAPEELLNTLNQEITVYFGDFMVSGDLSSLPDAPSFDGDSAEEYLEFLRTVSLYTETDDYLLAVNKAHGFCLEVYFKNITSEEQLLQLVKTYTVQIKLGLESAKSVKIKRDLLSTPDWNEANSSSSAYIKNRTHYVADEMTPVHSTSVTALTEYNLATTNITSGAWATAVGNYLSTSTTLRQKVYFYLNNSQWQAQPVQVPDSDILADFAYIWGNPALYARYLSENTGESITLAADSSNSPFFFGVLSYEGNSPENFVLLIAGKPTQLKLNQNNALKIYHYSAGSSKAVTFNIGNPSETCYPNTKSDISAILETISPAVGQTYQVAIGDGDPTTAILQKYSTDSGTETPDDATTPDTILVAGTTRWVPWLLTDYDPNALVDDLTEVPFCIVFVKSGETQEITSAEIYLEGLLDETSVIISTPLPQYHVLDPKYLPKATIETQGVIKVSDFPCYKESFGFLLSGATINATDEGSSDTSPMAIASYSNRSSDFLEVIKYIAKYDEFGTPEADWNTFTVIFDGVTYSNLRYTNYYVGMTEFSYGLGNPSIALNSGYINNEYAQTAVYPEDCPFFIGFFAGRTNQGPENAVAVLWTADHDTNKHTIKICVPEGDYPEEYLYHTLDPRYIQDTTEALYDSMGSYSAEEIESLFTATEDIKVINVSSETIINTNPQLIQPQNVSSNETVIGYTVG